MLVWRTIGGVCLVGMGAIAAVFSSCTPSADPIKYGQDQCAYCRMTIADARFAAQIVLKTGKNFKFDAIECMVWFLQEGRVDTAKLYQLLVANFAAPGKMIDGRTAWYLHSDQLKSPMGGNIAAFPSREVALQYQQELGGQLLRWQDLFLKVQKPGHTSS